MTANAVASKPTAPQGLLNSSGAPISAAPSAPIMLPEASFKIPPSRALSFLEPSYQVKSATIRFSNGNEMQLSFADGRGVQMKDIVSVETTYVQVVIDEVYPGSRWDDTCVAELEVWGVAE